MKTLAQQLSEPVQAAATKLGWSPDLLPFEPCYASSDARFGDYQSAMAFRMAKHLRTNPRALATQMVELLDDSPMYAEPPSVAGPGFINFRLAPEFLAADIAARAAAARFGTPASGEGKTLVLDYSSPNVAKRMHIGHLRSTVIGRALHGLADYLGYTTVADNHIGDWGTPFGKLIVAWERERDDAAFAADPVGELQRLYVWFGDAAKEQPELLDLARAETAKLQAGDPDARALWERFVAVSLEEFNSVYDRLGVSFDEVLGESAYDAMLPGVVQSLLDQGLAEEDDGAVIARFTAEDGKGLADKVLVVRKKDGAATYGTTDVATVDYRMERWSPSRIFYVVGSPQKQHFEQLFCLARKRGHTDVDLVHIGFGLLRFADGSIASSRSGGATNLVDVLDEAVRRAREVVDAREDGLSPDEKAAIAEAVGLSAVKYADLSQNPQTDIVFDWDKALAFTGNTAPYILYAHARCCSILRRAAEQGVPVPQPGTVPVAVQEAEARALALWLGRFPERVQVAFDTCRPNLLADALYQTASAFSSFYLACPVLKDDVDPAVRAARLALVQAVAVCLRDGLGVLGLSAPERM